ncbi:MAG: hypothetical protein Q9220_001802 [cf. Caloplaca sp. 1 TL-2023]
MKYVPSKHDDIALTASRWNLQQERSALIMLVALCWLTTATAATLGAPNSVAVSPGSSTEYPSDYLRKGPNYEPARANLAARTDHCEVPGTQTVLLIDQTSHRLFPFRMFEVLTQAQKRIQRKIREGAGDRIAEIPFIVIAWGLRISATPPPPPASVSLTWQMLNDTIEGLFQCAYNERMFFELEVRIMHESEVYLAEMGQLMLQQVAAAGDTA